MHIIVIHCFKYLKYPLVIPIVELRHEIVELLQNIKKPVCNFFIDDYGSIFEISNHQITKY